MPNYLDGVPAGSEAGVYEIVDDKSGLYVVDPAKGEFANDQSYLQPVGGGKWGLKDDRRYMDKPPGKWGIKNDDSELQQVSGGFGGLQGPGSKPPALHTEYTNEKAEWDSAYHGDVVFYMVRADQGSDPIEVDDFTDHEYDVQGRSGSGRSLGSENGGSSMGNQSKSSSSVQTGPNAPRGIQTSVNQVAVGSVVAQTVPMTAARKSLAGPMTGMDRNREIPAGAKSHASVLRQTLSQSVQNITQVVESLASDAIVKSFPASERFFYETLLKSYDPDITLGATRNAEEISTMLERGPIADFSVNLAIASGGIRSTRNLIEAINLGDVGYTSDASTTQSERYGPNGKARRYSR